MNILFLVQFNFILIFTSSLKFEKRLENRRTRKWLNLCKFFGDADMEVNDAFKKVFGNYFGYRPCNRLEVYKSQNFNTFYLKLFSSNMNIRMVLNTLTKLIRQLCLKKLKKNQKFTSKQKVKKLSMN